MRALFVCLAFLLGSLFLIMAIVFLLAIKSENDFFASLDCNVVQITDKELEDEELIIYYKQDGSLFGLYAMNESEFNLFDVIKVGNFIEVCTSNEIRIIKKIDAVSI